MGELPGAMAHLVQHRVPVQPSFCSIAVWRQRQSECQTCTCPKSTGLQQIAMLTEITTKTMQVFVAVISSVAGDFKLDMDIT